MRVGASGVLAYGRYHSTTACLPVLRRRPQARMEYDESVAPGKPRLLLGGTTLLLPQDVCMQLASGVQ